MHDIQSENDFKANPLVYDISIGPTYWTVAYTGCASEYYVSPVESGGQATTAINVEPSLLTLAPTIYSPTVALGAELDIAPGLLTLSPTIHSPTITVEFSLPSITGTILQWCEARLLTGLSDGDAVTTFTDQSGLGNHWSQSTSGSKPIFKTGGPNGHPVLRFDGTDDYLTLASDILSGETEGEVFLVVKIDNDPGASGVDGLWKMDGDGTNACHYPFNGNGEIYEAWGSTARKATAVNPTPALTSFRLYNVSSKASEYKIRLDGTEIYTTATNTFSSMTGSHRNLGRSVGLFGNAYLDGDIAAIVIVDTVLSGTDRDTIEATLGSTYGLTIA